MYLSVAITLACTVAGTSAQGLLGLPLDIATLLSSLGPAPASDTRFTTFKAPGPNDVRSPCPALNTLANHDFLHHNGRNMTLPHLLTGLASGLNIGADFTVAIGSLSLLASHDPLSASFDLSDLATHNFPIEHDASISRQDAHFGNPQPFHAPSFAQYTAVLDPPQDRRTTTSISSVSAAKFARFNDSRARNPEFVYGAREAALSYGENALYLQALGEDVVSGVAQLEYVKVFFEKERLPWAEGWRPSRVPVTLVTLQSMIVSLMAASPEPLGEPARILGDTYKDVLIGIAGGSKVLAALSGGISSALGL